MEGEKLETEEERKEGGKKEERGKKELRKVEGEALRERMGKQHY